MIKAIILLKRRDDLPFQAFRDWLLQDHAPMATRLPGIRGYQVNMADAEDGPYDAASELWFDSPEDLAAAYASDHGKTVAADSMAHVSRRDRLIVTENPFEIPSG